MYENEWYLNAFNLFSEYLSEIFLGIAVLVVLIWLFYRKRKIYQIIVGLYFLLILYVALGFTIILVYGDSPPLRDFKNELAGADFDKASVLFFPHAASPNEVKVFPASSECSRAIDAYLSNSVTFSVVCYSETSWYFSVPRKDEDPLNIALYFNKQGELRAMSPLLKNFYQAAPTPPLGEGTSRLGVLTSDREAKRTIEKEFGKISKQIQAAP